VLDVHRRLQFVVDHKSDYNIRVVNLSLKSSSAESYRTDRSTRRPRRVEQRDRRRDRLWQPRLQLDAVSYAPPTTPYVITVGAVDDGSNKGTGTTFMTSWSSRGATQTASSARPPGTGAHLASTVAARSIYTQLCPSLRVDGSYFKVGGTSMAAAVVSVRWPTPCRLIRVDAEPGQGSDRHAQSPGQDWSADLVDGTGTVVNNGARRRRR